MLQDEAERQLERCRVDVQDAYNLPKNAEGALQRARVLSKSTSSAAAIKAAFYPVYRGVDFDQGSIDAAVAATERALDMGTSGLLDAASALARAVGLLVPTDALRQRVRKADNEDSAFDDIHDTLADWLQQTVNQVHFNDVIDEG